jgi:hypothetical protein
MHPLPSTVDYIAGICVGFNQTLIGHPFDTIKTLQQTNKQWYGRPLTFYYRGVSYPLMAGVGFNALAFGVYEDAHRRWKNAWFAGGISGLSVVPLVAVSDGAKIARQTGLKLTSQVVVRGIPATLLRETTAMTAYFGFYVHLKDVRDYSPYYAGALCGLIACTISYPFDIIRSRQVALGVRFVQALNMGNIWRGYHMCAIRAVLVNATNFSVYESVKASFGVQSDSY